MAFGTNSKVFAFAVLDLMSAAINVSTNAFKIALYGNGGTPDNTVTTAALTEYNGTASAWVVANECGNSGTYAAGGSAITITAPSQSTNVVTVTSATVPSYTSATITSYGCLIYETTNLSKGLAYLAFGGAQTVTAGTFTVNFNASGIATFTT